MRKLQGFTLIELLVVMFIIALLATLVIVNVSSSRVTARDTRRQADVKTIKTALEQYYNQNTKYPGCSEFSPAQAGCAGNEFGYDISVLTNALTPKYISNIPTDPMVDSGSTTDPKNYSYVAGLDGDSYGIKIIWDDSTFCMTGVNAKFGSGGWWNPITNCNF